MSSIVAANVPSPAEGVAVESSTAGLKLEYETPRPPERSLRALVVRGSVWTLLGDVASRGIRLLSNVVLTRLLAPEVFGLMNVVNVVRQGLETFSDVGIGPSIVHNKRGEEPEFLNTAWTIQVVRGFLLCLASCVLAWPLVWVYQEPQLLWLLPATGLLALASGFASTSIATLNRRLALGKRTILEQSSYLFSVFVMIAWAWVSPTVWALVGGGIAGACFRTVLSHYLMAERRVRFQWDPAAASQLFRFGRWVFISTMLGFLAARGDRFVVAKMLPDMAAFGRYSIALVLATLVPDLLQHIGQGVLFPAYARLAKVEGSSLLDGVRRSRLAMMALGLPATWCFVLFGQYLVRFLYDARYEDASWMLRVLSVGGIASTITVGMVPVLMATGDVFRHTVVVAGRLTCLLAGMAVGAHYWGTFGLVAGVAAADFLNYPLVVWAVRRHGVWSPLTDLAALMVSAAALGLGFWFIP